MAQQKTTIPTLKPKKEALTKQQLEVELRLLNLLKKTKDEHLVMETFFKAVQHAWDEKTLTEAQVLKWQATVLSMEDFIELTGYLQKNQTSGLTFNEARELAQRYHMCLLGDLTKRGDHTQREVFETFKIYEEAVDVIFKGQMDEKKLKFLTTLPRTILWDKEKAQELYQAFKTK